MISCLIYQWTLGCFTFWVSRVLMAWTQLGRGLLRVTVILFKFLGICRPISNGSLPFPHRLSPWWC